MKIKFRAASKMAAMLCASVSLPSIALAQSSSTPLPVRTYVDDNGVDLLSGNVLVKSPILQAGGSEHLRYYQVRAGGVGYKDNLQGAVTVSGTVVTVSIGENTEQFNIVGGQNVPMEQRGSKLNGGGTSYAYVTADGTVYNFARIRSCASCSTYYTQWGDVPVIQSITYADKSSLSFVWQSSQVQVGQTPSGPALAEIRRVIAITSNDGYALNFKFQAEPWANAFTAATIVTKVTAFNTSQDGCVGGANCTTTAPRPFLAINGTSYTDALGRMTIVGTSSVRRPGSAVDNVTYAYNSSNRVSQVSADGVTTTYTYADGADGIRTVTISRAGAPARVVTFNLAQRSMKSDTDATGRKTAYEYDASARMTKVIAPELNSTTIGYDDRGNATSTIATGKDGVTLVSRATFPCTIAAACNSLMTSTDARLNVTNYDYDPNSGLPSKVTLPAAANGIRAEQRMGYTQVGGVWRLTSTSECRTTGPSSCIGGVDEIKTVITYAGATALPATVTVRAGDNSLSAASTMTYDAMGRLLTQDGPLPGADDTTRYYYDVEGQTLGTVGPDPDGPGALLRRAVKNTYNPAGQITRTESGTAADQSDAALTNMTVLQSAITTYDSNNRKIASSITAGGSAYAFGQVNYDNRGRVNCVVTRMNPAAFQSTADACSLGGEGSYGPDRITQTSYDDANRVLAVTKGLNTSAVSTDRTTYTLNGQQQTQTDANLNVTTYTYDRFDRLQKTSYPGGSNEQYGYDENANVTSRVLRDGQTLTYDYDALNRRTFDHNPKTNVAEVDVSYTYDNAGHVLRASDGNGWYSAFEIDALGRATRMYSNLSSTSLSYDLAGRLTRQTWADGFFASYEYLTTGETRIVRENGGLALANFGYDNFGRRTSLTRGNGTVTTYGFDPASRLTSLTQDLAGSAQDQTFNYTHNPAGQIASRSSSNDLYAFNGYYNVDRNYSANNLNQYIQSGTATLGYDARGNLTNAGNGSTYNYNTRNQLFMNNAGQLFYRGPNGLLGQSPGRNYDYVGANLASEFDGGTGQLVRRYVHGSGVDEPLVWYENGDRRYLHADERGSVVAVSNDAGTATAINSYDEYGIPGVNNQGRFQYTGQKWVPELGLYDYKARMYSPTLGRFVQTDLLGYGDGLNWYNYAGSDPINSRDSEGTNLGPNPTAAEIANYANGQSIMAQNAAARGTESATMHMSMQDSSLASAMLVAAAPLMKEIAEYHRLEALKSTGFVYFEGDNVTLITDYELEKSGALQTISKGFLQNPAVYIEFGDNFAKHVADAHLVNSPGYSSKFFSNFSSPARLAVLIYYAITSAVPTRGYYYTNQWRTDVGTLALRFGGAPTPHYTVSGYGTGQIKNGLPVVKVSNMYPGFP